jgi:hypothetical protein
LSDGFHIQNGLKVRWVPCHNGMARRQVVDGGDTIQLCRAAANILNKQSWTANKGWSSSLVVGHGLTTPNCKKKSLLQKFKRRLGPGRIPRIDYLRERKWT